MTVGAALLLIAAGAVLRFAVSTGSVYGIDLPMVGDILMGVGVLGLILWLAVWAPWARSRRSGYDQSRRGGGYEQPRQATPYPQQYQPQYPERRPVPPVDARTRELYQNPYYQDQYPS